MHESGSHLSGQIVLITRWQFSVLRNRRCCLNSIHTEVSSYHRAFLLLYDKKQSRIKWTEWLLRCVVRCFIIGSRRATPGVLMGHLDQLNAEHATTK